ncbi:FAD-dependent oxidoreductase [Rhodoblastus sp.]|jgi:monoamine oxidase|uniref:flavin monoamine oxidase family protein n=1 Tax=Rhodoblastus sp. TaxID=1962975 RepID=UPI0025FDF138|nr:FAD-dependent oxidoreductase [Rhodoblastus sp.]
MPDKPIEELDVAIVGGGVAGVYAAWRILTGGEGTKLWTESGKKPRVGLFEYSDRIGGRLLSMDLPGTQHRKIELGGMRYLNSHWRVVALKERFKLETRPLSVVDPTQSNLYYLRGQHFTSADWSRPSFVPPYRLDRGERGRSPGELLVEVCLKHRHRLGQLRNVGFWNLLLDECSLEAYQMVRDAGGYESIVGNWSAAEAIPFLLADFGPGLDYFAFDDGYQSIPLRLGAEAEANGATIRLQHRLHRLDLHDTAVQLTFDTNPATFRNRQLDPAAAKIIRARHVILALPRRSIELLHQDSFLFSDPQFQDDLKTVLAQPAFKIFAAYRRPWWQERSLFSGRSVTDLPVRQCYYWLPDDDVRPPGGSRPRDVNAILMASYNDSSSVQYWSGLARDTAHYEPPPFAVPPGVPIPNPIRDRSASASMVAELQDQLREIHGLSDVPDPATAQIIAPYAAVYQDWTQEPFGGGWHFWKIGVNARQVAQRIRRPVPTAPVYICGEAWSHQQGWVEGALETTDDLLQEEFGLSEPAKPASPAALRAAVAPSTKTIWDKARPR